MPVFRQKNRLLEPAIIFHFWAFTKTKNEAIFNGASIKRFEQNP